MRTHSNCAQERESEVSGRRGRILFLEFHQIEKSESESGVAYVREMTWREMQKSRNEINRSNFRPICPIG
jgi:hypothetical protein